jgi:regulator of protease activity HflC (stomatin/prohibitin superfamily)
VSVLLTVLFLGLLLGGALVGFAQDGSGRWSFRIRRAAPVWVAGFIVLTLLLSFTTVRAGEVGVVTRFGNVSRNLDPGLHFIIPFVEDVHAVNTQTQTTKPDEVAASHDLQVVHTQVTLAFHVDPSYAGYVYAQLNDQATQKVVIPAILEAIKATTAQYDAQQLIGQRAAVRDGIEDFVKRRLAGYHVIAENVSITDFNFSDEYNKSIEAKVTAAQLAEKAQNDLTRIKIEAEQKVTQATAEARALEIQKQAVSPELIQLRTIEMMDKHWDGVLPTVVIGEGGALPTVDLVAAAARAGGRTRPAAPKPQP